jgi:MIP family channel proteins
MDPRPRTYLAELIGTFLYVFVGAGTVCATYLTRDAPALDVTGIALAEGFALAVVLTAVLALSPGCLNPAITLMLWVFQRLGRAQTVALIGMQLLGALLAGLVLRLLFADDVLREAHLGTPHLKAFLGPDRALLFGSLVSGVGLETCLTFLVTLAFFASVVDPRGPRLGGVLVGLAQAAVILLGYRLTGGAANPARWFGPALWESTLHYPPTENPLGDHMVYWAGPVVGALLAGFFYSALILPPAKGKGPAG